MNNSSNIIILGCGNRLFAESRLDTFPEILKDFSTNKKINLILSGGDPQNTGKSEAEKMYDYLDENFSNILSDKRINILLEKYSKNTGGNLFYSFDMMLRNGSSFSDTFIITNDFHIARAERMAKYFSDTDFFQRIGNISTIATENYFREKEFEKYFKNPNWEKDLEKFMIGERNGAKTKIEKLIGRDKID